MYKGKKVSIVLPAFNEEKSIKEVIKGFRKLKITDEIIVVDNNSTDSTYKVAKKAGAQVIKEERQGYGFALRRGLKDAKGDFIILCEPDDTFDPQDAINLLSFIDEADMVQGTRTHRMYIQLGANLGAFLRIGNITVAKFMQILYRTGRLSDCGCTFRVIKKPLARKILPYFTVGKSHFLPELVILTSLAGKKIIEIPVKYKKRVGNSKITGSFKKAFLVGILMIVIICKYKILSPAKRLTN